MEIISGIGVDQDVSRTGGNMRILKMGITVVTLGNSLDHGRSIDGEILGEV